MNGIQWPSSRTFRFVIFPSALGPLHLSFSLPKNSFQTSFTLPPYHPLILINCQHFRNMCELGSKLGQASLLYVLKISHTSLYDTFHKSYEIVVKIYFKCLIFPYLTVGQKE